MGSEEGQFQPAERTPQKVPAETDSVEFKGITGGHINFLLGGLPRWKTWLSTPKNLLKKAQASHTKTCAITSTYLKRTDAAEPGLRGRTWR